MNDPLRILVAGIGNIFLGDDAFGVHVAQRMLQRKQPDGVCVVDFGIRGIDLVYALTDECDVAILVDAVPRGEPPGTLYLIEPDMPDHANRQAEPVLMEGHSMHPAKVLQMVSAIGGSVGRVLLLGCEPTPIDPAADVQVELSPPVQAAIEPAVQMLESLVASLQIDPLLTEIPHANESLGSSA